MNEQARPKAIARRITRPRKVKTIPRNLQYRLYNVRTRPKRPYVLLEGDGIKLTAVGANPFCFNASHYTQEELTEKAHNYELHPCGSTVLCLDYAQNGIGSASCGPRLAEQYRFDDASFDFSIRLIPEKA